MKNRIIIGFSMLIICMLLVACGKGNEEEVQANEANNGTNIEENEEENNEENEQNEANEEEEEEPTFADEVTVHDINEVYLDEEEVNDFEEDILIEHDQTIYIEQEFITDLVDLEVTYDEDAYFAEVFAGKGDYTYTANHEDTEGSVVELGEIYVDEWDEYINPEDEEVYDFVEYDGKLYFPKRVIEYVLEEPVHFTRRDGILALGKQEELAYLTDVETGGSMLMGDGVISTESKYTTIEGESYEAVATKPEELNTRGLKTYPHSEYAEINGFAYNHDDHPVAVEITDKDENVIGHGEAPAKGKFEFTYDIYGEDEVEIYVRSLSEALMPQPYEVTVYAEFR